LLLFCRQYVSNPAAQVKAQSVGHQLLATCRYGHMTGNFLAAIASHHSLLVNQCDIKQWLLESMQWAKASGVQRKDMQVGVGHTMGAASTTRQQQLLLLPFLYASSRWQFEYRIQAPLHKRS
jgi:hypothetical protein